MENSIRASVRHANYFAVTQTVRKPEFFIIGAPKSGTTSLYSYLAAHPQIYMPQLKEPFYFCSDLPAYREKATLITDAARYLKLFAGATDKHVACGEASPFYLFSKVAVPDILKFNPSARFIVLLRNPVDLVHSFHSQLVFSLHESVTDFEQAWQLQESRAQGRHIPRSCLEPVLLQYRQVGMLGDQVKRLFEHVDRNRVKILLFDEFVADPRRMYEEVLLFLGVPSDHRSKFPQDNANKTRRSKMLARLLRHPPFPLNVLRHRYIRHVGADTWPVRVLGHLNRKRVARTPLTPALRRELETEFHDDIQLLERLICRDLSLWVPPRRRTSRPLEGRN